MTEIWIERAECIVPRKGAQQQRRKLQEDLRKSHPAVAADLEAQPWYENPDGPFGGDHLAKFDWEWMGADQVGWGWASYLPIAKLPLIEEHILGEVQQPSDDENWLEFSFYLKASYAFSVLKAVGKIPPDSILMNCDERPLSYGEEVEAA